MKYLIIHAKSYSYDRAGANIFRREFYAASRFYGPEDISNVDETGLYINDVTSKSCVLAARKDKSNTKSDKTCLTLMLIVSMVGEKFPPLVIEKSENSQGLQKPRS